MIVGGLAGAGDIGALLHGADDALVDVVAFIAVIAFIAFFALRCRLVSAPSHGGAPVALLSFWSPVVEENQASSELNSWTFILLLLLLLDLGRELFVLLPVLNSWMSVFVLIIGMRVQRGLCVGFLHFNFFYN